MCQTDGRVLVDGCGHHSFLGQLPFKITTHHHRPQGFFGALSHSLKVNDHRENDITISFLMGRYVIYNETFMPCQELDILW